MKTLLGVSIAVCVAILGCSKSDNPNGPSGQGTVRVTMIDGPAAFSSVNIVITEVSVHKAGSDTSSGWVVVNNSTRTYNLLSLTNGSASIIGESNLDAGMYTQVRLKIGAGSNVVVGGVQFALDVSSNSEVKLNHPFTVSANAVCGLTVDFDADKSVHVTGTTQFKLNPVIRCSDDDQAGSISGTVSPAFARATISTVSGSDTLRVAADSASGAFKLVAVPAGTYSVKITPSLPSYADTTIAGVQVTARQDRSLGTINLSPR